MHGMVCMTLCDPMDCSLLGSSVHGMLGMFCQNLKELGKKKKTGKSSLIIGRAGRLCCA